MSQFSSLLVDPAADDMPLRPLDIVRDILCESENLPRLMELHYLAQEPGLIDIMRGLIALPEEERFRLQRYLARRRGRRLHARESPSGALILEPIDETRREEDA